MSDGRPHPSFPNSNKHSNGDRNVYPRGRAYIVRIQHRGEVYQFPRMLGMMNYTLEQANRIARQQRRRLGIE
jgi:hypothetical protein